MKFSRREQHTPPDPDGLNAPAGSVSVSNIRTDTLSALAASSRDSNSRGVSDFSGRRRAAGNNMDDMKTSLMPTKSEEHDNNLRPIISLRTVERARTV